MTYDNCSEHSQSTVCATPDTPSVRRIGVNRPARRCASGPVASWDAADKGGTIKRVTQYLSPT